MKSVAFFCLAFLALQANGDVSKCNPEIIEYIKTYWYLTGGPPKDVLKDLEDNGRGALQFSTYNDHITSQNLTEPKCVFADITKDSAVFSVVLDNGEIQSNNVSVTEKEEGVIYIKEEDRKIFVIFQKDGVTIYYTCSDSGEERHAEGAVAIALQKYNDQSKKLGDFGANLLYAFGIELQVEFSDACFK